MRRLLLSVLILFGVSMIIYTIVRMMPGDYISSITAGNPMVTPEKIARLRMLYGLDTGVVEGYFKWLSQAIRGNFGDSFIYRKPVAEIISSKMWTSFSLAFTAFILEIIIAVPLGIISATRQYSKTDYAVTTVALVGISLPTFFFAAILQRVFSMELGLLPLQGMVTARYDYQGFMLFLDIAKHFILPITVFVITGVGSLMRYSRTNMLEVLNADYVRTARAKGLSEQTVIYKHAFRNTLIPIVTLIGGSLPGLFSGAIITEGIFAIDGLGRTALIALRMGDIPFIMAFNMFLAVLTLLGTIIADILYAVVDPRVRLS
ncbi:ABC transporter permease [Thiospirochaeta perfilievii]|uniref:ABC transporter permease n=1 Tax=Thiospirochaeta perfilievii TaxID=252967 RepID=UPI002482EEEE|nr:ABC transporter permease [Thiospirochaeta perfilievii]